MKAIGYYQSLPINDTQSLVDLELPKPKPEHSDILVEVKAISVNPIDTKVRKLVQPKDNKPMVLGWDVAGTVVDIGPGVTLFKPGDEVWYAGDKSRPGANSEFHLVDEKLAAKKPNSLDFTEAAALPLTSVTAWEILFDRLKVPTNHQGVLLITGAAGGVGSILVQLARQMTQLTIIGTASRPESVSWILKNGAHHVIDHSLDLKSQLKDLGIHEVDYVISLTHTDEHANALVGVLKPQGQFALIDDPQQVDIKLFKIKSISIHWESMFTRSFFKTPDMIKQHEILSKIAKMVDDGKIKTTLAQNLGPINAENLKKAHALIESGQARGKLVLSGF